MHYTETCEEQRPEIVVHVATTIAPVQDGQLTGQIHDDLAQTALTPAEHLVDAAYITPAHVQRAQQVHGITLLAPIVADPSRQAQSGEGFGKSAFTIDWDLQQATCPRGKTSTQPGTLRINGHEYLQFRFAKADCLACPDRHPCTASATRPRSIALLPQPLHEIQVRNRLDQQTEEWQRRYAVRAGIEATLSQTVRSNGLRRTRYRGLAKTHVQHVLTNLACNLTRTADWIAETPRGRIRSSRFHTLHRSGRMTPEDHQQSHGIASRPQLRPKTSAPSSRRTTSPVPSVRRPRPGCSRFSTPPESRASMSDGYSLRPLGEVMRLDLQQPFAWPGS
ncbi:transposase [Streptomyces sp. 061-3]|uniref:transposase n=1 Tax=Streptomyces sp. 061-3 TaxID=2789268 RepID=UPI003980D354